MEVFVKSLYNKPTIIVCTETWIIQPIEYFQLSGYNIYYNSSKINRADGVVLYIRKVISHEINVIEIDRIKFLVADLSINDNENLKISATYRSHDIPKTEYVLSTKKFLIENRKVKNHFIIGDFNIDIISNDVQKYENNINQVFLSNFLAREYFPCFTDVTRPSTIGHGGTCIDNVFIKSNTINIVSYKIANPFNDHFPLFDKCNNVKLSSNDNNRINERINYDKLKKNC